MVADLSILGVPQVANLGDLVKERPLVAKPSVIF